MSKKREFPILNGKLISDLDANGHEIKRLRLTQDQVVDVIKLVGVVPFVEDRNGNKTAVTIGSREAGKSVGKHSLANGYEVTASGEHAHAEGCSTTAAGDYSHAEGFYAHTKEQDIYAFVWNGDGMRFAPYESHGSGTFNINPFGGLDGFYIGEQTLAQVINAVIADAQIDSKINTIIADDAGKSARTIAAEEVAKVVADAPADFDTLKEIAEYIESDKTGAAQMVTKIDDNAKAISAEAQRAQEAEAALRRTVEGKVDKEAGKGLSTNDYTNEDKEKLGTAYTPDNPPPAPDLSGYATKDAALPRYYFANLEVVDGVVTVPPYTNAGMLSDGTAFTVAVGGEGYYMRDCILFVMCGDVAPTITWPANFHPRTDAETDFACVAGVNNVYWISEYVQGEFVVAGWQATAGGSAQ